MMLNDDGTHPHKRLQPPIAYPYGAGADLHDALDDGAEVPLEDAVDLEALPRGGAQVLLPVLLAQVVHQLFGGGGGGLIGVGLGFWLVLGLGFSNSCIRTDLPHTHIPIPPLKYIRTDRPCRARG